MSVLSHTAVMGDRMSTTIDFSGASRRHYNDAELLMTNARIPNAGHLLGFAAECGIKALLVAHNLPTDPVTGDIVASGSRQYRTHINILVNSAQTFSGSRNYATYLGMLPSLGAFQDWDASHRYFAESAIPSSVLSWHQAAKEVITMLDQARLDGVIP